jgi:uroporphyrinogen III methyltransferase/synthase
MNVGKVFLVGTGPGDVKLITVKGLECIKNADAVVYDRLINTRLLSFAVPGAELIYVGKAPDRHTLKQEEINRVLIDEAKKGKVVVRLKGGDPFVFGRGGEEAQALQKEGIPFEIVPGITSAIAVPAYAGIPVTHRDFTSTFTVITGHEDPNKVESSINWDRLAADPGTLIFLMGVNNLPQIVDKLINAGKDGGTPTALVSRGTRPEQKVVSGELATIVEEVKKNNLTSPAVIIVGEVVKLREKIMWFESKPLFGKRVLVTRSREQAGVLSEKIEQLGGEALEFPAISIKPPGTYDPLDAAIRKSGSYDWIIFTSVNGVRFFFERVRQLKVDIRSLGKTKICAIGPKTAEALEEKGIIVEMIPEKFCAEAIIEKLGKKLKPGQKVLLPRADLARPILVTSLQGMGAEVEEVIAYRTTFASVDDTHIQKVIQNKGLDVITFTSSSTVQNFVSLLGKEQVGLLKDVTIACIGPITAETAASLGLKVDVTAVDYTIDGLVEALVDYFKK